MATDIGDDAGDGLAGEGFFSHPEEISHILCTHDQELAWIESERQKSRPIGQAKKLPVLCQLQVKHGHASRREEGLCLAKGKTETGATIAHGVGKHLLEKATGQGRKCAIRVRKGPRPHLRQSRFALDIGNGFTQRGEALLVIGGVHDLTAYMNKTGTW